MERMTFTTDRTTVTEGEIVEVHWDCPGASSVDMTIDNGFKSSVIPLEQGGSKRFRLNRSKGRTKMTLTAYVEGKPYSKTIRVKVKEIPVTKAETVDHQGRTMSRLRQWLNMPRWQMFWRNYRQAKMAMPKEKRLASRILLLLGLVMLLSTLSPVLMGVGMMAVAGYLGWVILKR